MSMIRFTETDTESFYDKEDSLYRSFWDKEGSLHWGYYDNIDHTNSQNFILACQQWNELMLQKSYIDHNSHVLDIGCGNGNTAIWLAKKTGCKVIGIDLSAVRIENAIQKSSLHPTLDVTFIKASATELPFPNSCFTHVWSQATLYHVHELNHALKEVERVLLENGVFIFDDLISPSSNISDDSKKYVYDRLLFSPKFNKKEYLNQLNKIGLLVSEDINLSTDLHKSYGALSQLALKDYPELSHAYQHMQEAIKSNEISWHFYLCKKISDRLDWIYRDSDPDSLRDKYRLWSQYYDLDLHDSYRSSTVTSAKCLAGVLTNKDASIADIGAGTGMVGEALHQLGFTNISAIDFSPQMLDIAKSKNIYTSIHIADIETPLSFDNAQYDAMIAVGVFTYAHANPSALTNLNNHLNINGYFILTVRNDYYHSQSLFTEIINSLSWKLISTTHFNIFDHEDMQVFIFKKVEKNNI